MYFSVNDGMYWYVTYGEGEPLVLLHGFTGSNEIWTPLIRDLQQYYQIIVVDLPGHGKTVLGNPRTMEMCCRDLHALFTSIGMKKMRIAGYSMGGRVALSYSMYYPEQVQFQVLMSASPGLKTIKEQENRVIHDEKLAQELEKEGLITFIDRWEQLPLFATQETLTLEQKKNIRKNRLTQQASGLAQSLRYMGTGVQPSWWGDLSRCYVSTILLVGEKDTKFVEINRQMYAHMPRDIAHIEIAKDTGHAIYVENPHFFVKIIERLYQYEQFYSHSGSIGKQQ